MGDRVFKFPALNVRNVGRIELLARTEEACAEEAITIYRAILEARIVSSCTRPSVPTSTAMGGVASLCDVHCRVGFIDTNERGDLIYVALQ